MIDADTELISPITFFDANGRSKIYTTPYEYNLQYKTTATHITKSPLAKWRSSIVQQMSISSSEYDYLIQALNNYLPKKPNQSIGQWIAEIVIKSTIDCHHSFNGSYFSEQDLVAAIHLMHGSTCCGNLNFLRNRVTGYLSKHQILISRLIGIKHVTYESWQMRTPRSSKMGWKDFVLLLLYQRARVLIPAWLIASINLKLKLK
jgi:hypothetical protein